MNGFAGLAIFDIIINDRPDFLFSTGVGLWQATKHLFYAVITPTTLERQQRAGFMRRA
jgi:hypothetical protein